MSLRHFALSLSPGEGEHKLLRGASYWAILANGDADFHDNVIFFGFDEKRTDPVLVAKVPRLIENGWMLKTEYDHLVELWNCIGEEAANYVPRPYAMTTLQDRPVLMISYVSGESLHGCPAGHFGGTVNRCRHWQRKRRVRCVTLNSSDRKSHRARSNFWIPISQRRQISLGNCFR